MKKYEETSLWEKTKKYGYGYTLMLWDGLGFFGTDHAKLGRIKGEKVNFCTKFSSPRTLTMSLLGIILGIYLLYNELQLLNT